MKASSQGAMDAHTTSIALKAKMLPAERINVRLATHELSFKWMFVRRFAMAIRAHASIFFPGGIGTLNEFYEYVMLMQNGIVEKSPIILVGKDFWVPLLSWMRKVPFAKGYISEKDFQLFQVVDGVEDIVPIVEKYTERYGKLNVNSFLRQNDISRAVLQYNRELGRHVVRYGGMDFVVYDQVFSPEVFNGWRVFTARLSKENFIGKDMLEVGCGSGITGLFLCKKKGLGSLLLSDINPYAVANTRENIDKFGIGDRAEVCQSNVFDKIPKRRRFDIIYWNYPWLPEAARYEYKDEVERGLFDPDYRYLKKYLQEARKFLRKGGRVFLGFGDFGDIDYLTFLSKRENYVLHEMVKQPGREGKDVQFILYELIPEEHLGR